MVLNNLHKLLNDSWRGIQHSDPAKSAAWTSLTSYLRQICESSGFQVDEPQVGDKFDYQKHKVLEVSKEPGSPDTIRRVYGVGLRINEDLHEKSTVVIYH